jgi:hypothetical protein
LFYRVNCVLIDPTSEKLPLPFTRDESGVLQFLEMMRNCRARQIHAAADLAECLLNCAQPRTAWFFLLNVKLRLPLAGRGVLALLINHHENLQSLLVGECFKYFCIVRLFHNHRIVFSRNLSTNFFYRRLKGKTLTVAIRLKTRKAADWPPCVSSEMVQPKQRHSFLHADQI